MAVVTDRQPGQRERPPEIAPPPQLQGARESKVDPRVTQRIVDGAATYRKAAGGQGTFDDVLARVGAQDTDQFVEGLKGLDPQSQYRLAGLAMKARKQKFLQSRGKDAESLEAIEQISRHLVDTGKSMETPDRTSPDAAKLQELGYQGHTAYNFYGGKILEKQGDLDGALSKYNAAAYAAEEAEKASSGGMIGGTSTSNSAIAKENHRRADCLKSGILMSSGDYEELARPFTSIEPEEAKKWGAISSIQAGLILDGSSKLADDPQLAQERQKKAVEYAERAKEKYQTEVLTEGQREYVRKGYKQVTGKDIEKTSAVATVIAQDTTVGDEASMLVASPAQKHDVHAPQIHSEPITAEVVEEPKKSFRERLTGWAKSWRKRSKDMSDNIREEHGDSLFLHTLAAVPKAFLDVGADILDSITGQKTWEETPEAPPVQPRQKPPPLPAQKIEVNAGQAPRERSFDEANREGLAALGKGDVAGAEGLFREAVERDKYNPLGYSNLAVALAKQRRFEESAQLAAGAILLCERSSQPNNAVAGYAYNTLGVASHHLAEERKQQGLLSQADRLERFSHLCYDAAYNRHSASIRSSNQPPEKIDSDLATLQRNYERSTGRQPKEQIETSHRGLLEYLTEAGLRAPQDSDPEHPVSLTRPGERLRLTYAPDERDIQTSA